MSLGKHPTYVDESYRTFQEEVAGALDGKDHSLLEPGTADNSVKLNTAVANALLVMMEKLQPGTGKKDDVNCRMLGKEGTVKVIQNATINYGARVMVDSGAMTKVKAVPGTTGTYRSLGWKCSQGGGAQNDIIEIVDYPETIVVP
jgi:hypothetical protein